MCVERFGLDTLFPTRYLYKIPLPQPPIPCQLPVRVQLASRDMIQILILLRPSSNPVFLRAMVGRTVNRSLGPGDWLAWQFYPPLLLPVIAIRVAASCIAVVDPACVIKSQIQPEELHCVKYMW